METIAETPTITTVEELANTIINFWVDVTDNGYKGKVPYAEGRGKIVDTYNMMMFTQDHENTGKKWFTEEEIALAKTRCVELLQTDFLFHDWGFSFHNASYGMGCFFTKTFGDAMDKRETSNTFDSILFKTKLFSAELRMQYFPPKEIYSKYLNRICADIIKAGKYTEKEKQEQLNKHPERPMLAVSEPSFDGPWQIIAYVDL